MSKLEELDKMRMSAAEAVGVENEMGVGCVITTLSGQAVAGYSYVTNETTIHAEQMALSQAAATGVSTHHGTAYITLLPSSLGFYLLVHAGIVRIVLREGLSSGLYEVSSLDQLLAEAKKLSITVDFI